jgi:hypothetical protein
MPRKRSVLAVEVKKKGTCKLHKRPECGQVSEITRCTEVLFILKYSLLEGKGFLITQLHINTRQQTDFL